MKNCLLKLLGILFIFSLFISCSEDDKDLPTLEVSKSILTFPNTASSEVININTNQNNFNIEVSEEWIKTEKSEKNITVSVSDNPLAKNRKGHILVKSGDLKKTITVTQNGAEVNIVALPKSFDIEAIGGAFNFNVSINTDNYLIASGNEWITLNLDSNNKSVVNFTVSENRESETRIGKIKFLIAGKIVEEVIITQSGISAHYTLPYLNFGATATNVKDFEEKRKNKILRENDISGTGTQVAFKVNDNIFNEFVYLINLKGYVQSSMFVKDGTINDEDKSSFEKFLLQEGFETKTEEGYETTLSSEKVDKTVFVNTKKQVKIEFMADKKHNHYRVIYYPQQNRDYTTFNEFPFFLKNAKKEQVVEYEKTHNGTLNENKSIFNNKRNELLRDILYFDISGEEIMARTYYVYHEGQTKHGLVQVTNYYADVHLAFYQGLDGDYYLTKEFLELAAKNGFKYTGVSRRSGASLFKNDDKNIYMSVKWEKNEIFNWALRISIYE